MKTLSVSAVGIFQIHQNINCYGWTELFIDEVQFVQMARPRLKDPKLMKRASSIQ